MNVARFILECLTRMCGGWVVPACLCVLVPAEANASQSGDFTYQRDGTSGTVLGYSGHESALAKAGSGSSFVGVPKSKKKQFARLRVQINGHGMVSMTNGQLLEIGSTNIITATSKQGYALLQWTSNLLPSTDVATLQFVMQSNLTLTAKFSPVVLPTFTIDSPGMGEGFADWPLHPTQDDTLWVVGTLVNGTKPVTDLWFQLNGGDWFSAPPQISNFVGWDGPRPHPPPIEMMWNVAIHPSPGLNLLKAYAVDAVGNRTATKNIFFVCITASALNTVDSFAPMRGTYSGLFTNVNGADLPGAGLFTATLNSSGVCTARFSESGRTYSASGRCSADGMLALNFGSRSNVLAAELQLNLDGTDQFAGEITGSNWTSRLVANRDVSKTNAMVPAGRYTLALAGGSNSNEPGGYGYGAAQIDSSGRIAFSGTLGDGIALAQTGALSKHGEWPFYASLYSGGGAILGWLMFTNAPDRDIDALLTWTKPARARDKLFKAGFTNQVEVAGSRFFCPASERCLDITNGVLLLDRENLSGSSTNEFALKANNTASGPQIKALTINRKSGLFTGTVSASRGKNIAIRGAVLQKENVGYGQSVGTNQTCRVILKSETE